MESDKPMDRLICGDVGFGKTEVAIRAAFKAVLDRKQVAVLVPTTILAHQHYKTFTERLEKYGVKIEVLSRFKTKKQQIEILDKLADGKIDIIIGTHRLLSRDVRFKDLGLLIIDEEHRFGVEAKERLRKMKTNVDTLTLSATPIPRTLYFSLMGARDMSIINTPPPNRLPIITKIINFEPKLIREAVLFEIGRQGQVYFVVDKISEIEKITEFIRSTIPEVKFDVVHGKMRSSSIEKVMMRFLDGKFDLLVSTKIIEAGIDIPNVNTIFIYNAHTFGLAELYQLRGRVGRSNRQAYAYFIVPPLETIGTNAIRRLVAIEEFTELGSGLRLAMRDMEIRGVGNLFGKEQTGFINSIGFDMYCRILEEAIEELKREEFEDMFKEKETRVRKKIEAIVSLDIPAYIPEHYIGWDSERFDYYRRLYEAKSVDEVDEIFGEMEDRFGRAPEEVENLIFASKVKVFAESCGISRVEFKEGNVYLHPDKNIVNENSAFERLLKSVRELGLSFRLQGSGEKVKFVFRFDGSFVAFLNFLERLSSKLSNYQDNFATYP